MPVPIQWLTCIVPARYLIPSLQTVFLAGDMWPLFLPNIGAMLLLGAVFFTLAGARPPARGSTEMLARLRALIVKELLAVLRDPKGRMMLIVPPSCSCSSSAYRGDARGEERRHRVLEPRRWPLEPASSSQRIAGSATFRERDRRSPGSAEAARGHRPAPRAGGGPCSTPTSRATSRRAARPRFRSCSTAGAPTPRRSSRAISSGSSAISTPPASARRRAATARSSRHWFNPNLDYVWFTVPSLIAVDRRC